MKILLTTLVIAGAVLVIRRRQRHSQLMVVERQPKFHSRKRFSAIYIAAYLLLALLIAGSVLYFFNQWQDSNRIVLVKVIDTTTGRVVEFEAYKKDVDGRSFRTIDGRKISLAAVERLEVTVK